MGKDVHTKLWKKYRKDIKNTYNKRYKELSEKDKKGVPKKFPIKFSQELEDKIKGFDYFHNQSSKGLFSNLIEVKEEKYKEIQLLIKNYERIVQFKRFDLNKVDDGIYDLTINYLNALDGIMKSAVRHMNEDIIDMFDEFNTAAKRLKKGLKESKLIHKSFAGKRFKLIGYHLYPFSSGAGLCKTLTDICKEGKKANYKNLRELVNTAKSQIIKHEEELKAVKIICDGIENKLTELRKKQPKKIEEDDKGEQSEIDKYMKPLKTALEESAFDPEPYKIQIADMVKPFEEALSFAKSTLSSFKSDN